MKNRDRIDAAYKCLLHMVSLGSTPTRTKAEKKLAQEGKTKAIADMLKNLKHYCHFYKVDFNEALRLAEEQFKTEINAKRIFIVAPSAGFPEDVIHKVCVTNDLEGDIQDIYGMDDYKEMAEFAILERAKRFAAVNGVSNPEVI